MRNRQKTYQVSPHVNVELNAVCRWPDKDLASLQSPKFDWSTLSLGGRLSSYWQYYRDIAELTWLIEFHATCL